MTREEAIDILQNTSFFGRVIDDIDTAIEMAIEALEQEEKTGKWDVMSGEIFKCSECKQFSDKITDFCPNCGAKMEVEK